MNFRIFTVALIALAGCTIPPQVNIIGSRFIAGKADKGSPLTRGIVANDPSISWSRAACMADRMDAEVPTDQRVLAIQYFGGYKTSETFEAAMHWYSTDSNNYTLAYDHCRNVTVYP
jgi:hypothetical protein